MHDVTRRREYREQVKTMEEVLLAHPDAHVDLPVRHYFAGGVYAREMSAPAGTIAIGKIIKVPNIATISKGDVSILTENGVMRVQAPYTWVAPAGTKRAAYFHADTVWTVYHATESTDIEEIERQVIAEGFDDPDLLHAELLGLSGEGC